MYFIVMCTLLVYWRHNLFKKTAWNRKLQGTFVYFHKTRYLQVLQENIHFKIIAMFSTVYFCTSFWFLSFSLSHSLSSVFKYSCSALHLILFVLIQTSVSHLRRGIVTELSLGLKRDVLKVWYVNLDNQLPLVNL